MTLATDIAGDYAYLDGTEAVTLTKPGTTSTTSVSAALRRRVTTREAAASNGHYTTADVAWHLPQSLVTTQPALGDKVLDSSSVYWTILSVSRDTLGTRWRCISRDLAVANRLDTFVTIEYSTIAKGVGGAVERDWSDWRSGVRARIQPQAVTQDVENRTRVGRATHVVFCDLDAGELSAAVRFRVRDEAGATYTVLAVRAPERIDELTQLDVVETPWLLG